MFVAWRHLALKWHTVAEIHIQRFPRNPPCMSDLDIPILVTILLNHEGFLLHMFKPSSTLAGEGRERGVSGATPYFRRELYNDRSGCQFITPPFFSASLCVGWLFNLNNTGIQLIDASVDPYTGLPRSDLPRLSDFLHPDLDRRVSATRSAHQGFQLGDARACCSRRFASESAQEEFRSEKNWMSTGQKDRTAG